jgi:RluA family pseudouridine synthase
MSQLHLVLQTAEIIVVDKPFGLSVHNSEGDHNVLELASSELGIPKLYPVHRLDKETSGLQILALNEQAASKWGKVFEGHQVQKVYVGLLRGAMKHAEGEWTWPLTDKGEGRKNPQGVQAQRKPCKTTFRVLESNKYFSLSEFVIHTGRQHQIRKHAAMSGHALVGDARYGDPKYNDRMAAIYRTPRMFLHAVRLSTDVERVFPQGRVECELPEDFKRLMQGAQ